MTKACARRPRNDEGVALRQLDDRLGTRLVSQRHIEVAIENEEELVGVVVRVPPVLAGEYFAG